MKPRVSLPYFDILLGEIQNGKRDIATAFGRHVHWGYWDDAHPSDGTMENFVVAADRMSQRVWQAGGAANGQRILDVGCGFGGTIATIDEKLDDVDLVGLNIDGRQLERARAQVKPRGRNKIEFVEGDACAMPFPDASFDLVLAVECAFHFPSRAKFFSEVRRVLKPGGRLSLCDIVPSERGRYLLPMQRMFFQGYSERLGGKLDLTHTVAKYRALAQSTGFDVLVEEDVTKNSIPTYRVLRHVIREAGKYVRTALWGTGAMEVLSRANLMNYVVLSYVRRDTPQDRARSRESAAPVSGAVSGAATSGEAIAGE